MNKFPFSYGIGVDSLRNLCDNTTDRIVEKIKLLGYTKFQLDVLQIGMFLWTDKQIEETHLSEIREIDGVSDIAPIGIYNLEK